MHAITPHAAHETRRHLRSSNKPNRHEIMTPKAQNRKITTLSTRKRKHKETETPPRQSTLDVKPVEVRDTVAVLPILRIPPKSDPAILPLTVTVNTFAQQTTNRAREQQRSHNEYVALLRENRQKARPIKTGKSYERVRRWWVVRVMPLS